MRYVVFAPFALLGLIVLMFMGELAARKMESPGPLPAVVQTAPDVQPVPGGHAIVDAAPTRPAAQAAPQPGGDWRAVEAKLAAAQSLRAFVYEVLRKPEQGGVYYATSVIFQCRAVLRQGTEGLPAPQRQAIESMRARCDFSRQEADDALRQITAIRQSKFVEDPVLGPVFGFLRAKDDDARIAVLGSVIDGGNPGLIAAMVSPALRNALPPGIVTHGEGPGNYAYYAALLVECELGAACSGDRSLRVTELCTKSGWCADNVRDALRIGLGDKFGPIDRLAARFTNDIRKRNYPPLLRGA